MINSIHVLHQNISGLISKSDLLTLHLKYLHTIKSPIDVIGITEHNMQAGREDLLALPDYQLVSHYCRDNKNKGGSCILVRKGIQCKDLFGISKLSVKGVFECCAVELTDLQVVVACVYRVPKKKQKAAYLELFYDKMTILLNELCIQKHRHVIICGDFNINILENNKQTREFNDFLLG